MTPKSTPSIRAGLVSQTTGAFAPRLIGRAIVRRLHSYGPTVALDVLVVTAALQVATVLRFIDGPDVVLQARADFLPCVYAGIVYAATAHLLGLHRRLWHYASLRDGFALMRAVVIATLAITALDFAIQQFGPVFDMRPQARPLPLSVVLGGAFLSFLFLGSLKMLPRVVRAQQSTRAVATTGNVSRVLIVGAGQAGASLAALLLINSERGYQVVGFVDDDPEKLKKRIRDLPILGSVADIPDLTSRLSIDLIAIALPSAGVERVSEIIATCQQTSARIEILPGLAETVGHQPHALQLRQVNVANLLGREIVPLRTPETANFLRGKRILVTGAAGSIGSELCRQLITYEPAEVIAVDNNETGLFDLATSLYEPEGRERLRVRIGDITDSDTMARLFESSRPHVVFHAAAYKHVPLLEQHPQQAIHTNVLGTYHLCCQARQHQVGAFVFISSDKAAEPVSVLGASKRLGEIIVQAMAGSGDSQTNFCAVRFGNVIGSRGSVVPLFEQQIEHGGPVTVTDPAATRYFMTIPEACGLVLLTATMAGNGDLFLLDMGTPVRIADLASKMIRLRGLRVGNDIHIEYVGLRPGERLHEMLAGPDERLLPTAHNKILHVEREGGLPTVTSIDQRMRELQDRLAVSDMKALRNGLLDLARERASV